MTLERGALLNGRYRIVDILGQGGMGAVYRAVDENIELVVAVKENLYLSPEYTRQFRREAVILASLHNPSLPRVSDYFLIPGQGQYMVMDYIEGEDLRQRMERVGRIPEQEVILIGAAMCNALTYLHTRQDPIIHRDVKPGNVKITPKGRVALVDFGLAKVMTADQQATTTGARAMTPGFSPPEQYGTGRTDPRTDIYSLAATLYAALTGVIPEDGLARATGNADLTPIRDLNPDVGRRTAAVIERALDVDPDRRYQTAEDFKYELLEARGDLDLGEGAEISIPPAPFEPQTAPDGSSTETDSTPVPAVLPHSTHSRRRTYPKRVSTNWMALIVLLIIGSGLFYAVGPGRLPQSVAGWFGTTRAPTLSASTGNPSAPASTATSLPYPNPQDSPRQTATLPVILPGLTPTLEDTPPTPTVTPVGGGMGQIAFVSNRTGGLPQIWVMDPNGNRQVQITNVTDGACQPSWNPNGTEIVFTSPCNAEHSKYPGSSLFIWDKDGSITPVPPSPGGDYDPAWSPTGKEIAFTSLREGHPQIYIYNVLDKSFKNISNSVFPDHEPAWNSAGSLIAFIRTQVSDQVWYMSNTGTHADLYAISGEFNDQNPFWSPDGQVLFYGQTTATGDLPWLMAQRYKDRGAQVEFRIPAKGQVDPGPVRHASISPDGFWVVFEGWPQGENHDIYRMTVNGANFQRLTSDRDADFDPTWGPGSLFP
ncbi:MAG TPA: protein kinase [Anaerolineaceae bacterium]|jgi:serine/threonine protein kinase/Tol biopolymer transport system component